MRPNRGSRFQAGFAVALVRRAVDRELASEAGFDRLVKPVHGEALRRLLGKIPSLDLAAGPN